MRVTNAMMMKTLTDGIGSVSERLMRNQEMLSSGKKVNRPSDDPVTMGNVMEHKDVIKGLTQYVRNIDYATEQLGHAESAMSKVTETLTRLKELAIATASDTVSESGRLNTSYEVELLRDELVSTANTNVNDKYIFSGFLTRTEPFDATGNYLADSNERVLNVAPGTRFVHGLPGDRVFSGAGISGGTDIFAVVDDFLTALQTDDAEAVRTAVGTLDDAMRQVGDSVSEIGARLTSLGVQRRSTEEFELQTRTLLSNLEDSDFTEVAVDLTRQQTSLEALQMTTAKFTNMNIFNFIR